MADDGGPVSPMAEFNAGNFEITHKGMSLRDYFAGQALAGQITFEGMEGCDAELIAGMSYELADHMLAARNKEPK